MIKGNSCGICGRGRDVCMNPICGQPAMLSVYAPVVYDEIGINVCRPLQIPTEIVTANPTVNCVQLEVIDVMFPAATGTTPGTTVTILDRANCVGVVLTNVLVTYRVKLFDVGGNYLTSTIMTANYLPGSAESVDYIYVDDDTNPESVSVEMYTPYGVGYTEAGGAPIINTVGLLLGSNTVVNGINASVVAKAMDFNPVTGILSAGISLVLRTVYYEVYKFEHGGKPITPKAELNGAQNNVCLEFVEGGLLSREIKPLELEPPKCEQRYKEEEQSVCEMNDGVRQIDSLCEAGCDDTECTLCNGTE